MVQALIEIPRQVREHRIAGWKAEDRDRMRCQYCGSESGEIDYTTSGEKVFLCMSCFRWAILKDRLEKDVGK
jgi:ribosomal protein S14